MKKLIEFPRLIYDSEKCDYSIENAELKNDSCSTTEVLETTPIVPRSEEEVVTSQISN
jgi:hypothetical protein